ncbi:interferon-stimulated 20 kDa exonuclease-like 2 [Myripristis murdjan]|uniref:Interferon stimulated exonuclease 20 like 2 n=1 Tax=Myripristis murdjan TaxID=586833 RepID=A0A667ZLU3_9TELE|nr:interferon-stimulated 20 kDa exonuclease-like 2 [Myripristis murdjan]
MSGMTINLCSSDEDPPANVPSGSGNDKHKKFLQRRKFLERSGYLKDKQNKRNRRKGQFKQGHGPQEQTPWRNGMRQLLPPAASPHGPNRAVAANCGSKPSASINSSASLTVTVTNTGSPGRSTKTVNIKSAATASVTSSQKPTATLPSGSATCVNPTKYLAIDCEMVGTGPKGSISQLARCSIVSYDGDVVYDKFIKPSVPVTDYRTRWSGIRQSDLAKATPFTDARKEILKMLMGKVVIGHAVHNDFKVLGYCHPAALTRDTSRIPLLNAKAGFCEREVASLKRLTKAIFNRDIQTGKRGHSSVEDAKATMELYKVVEAEWERKLVSKS